jgi:hypothetical protein
MQIFRMHEFVFVGEPERALAFRDEWLERGTKLLAALGLSVQAVPANDPFFGRSGRILAAGQQENELKFELVTPITVDTAISSANYHEDHFGRTFGLTCPDGRVAHSACFALGLDRIVLALVREHGTDMSGWPDVLGLSSN